MIHGGDPQTTALLNGMLQNPANPLVGVMPVMTPERAAELLAWYRGEGRGIFNQPQAIAEKKTHEL
jgi:hypothetical protein